MREIKDQKWYKRLQKPPEREFNSFPVAQPIGQEPAQMEVANEADKSLRRLKENRSRF